MLNIFLRVLILGIVFTVCLNIDKPLFCPQRILMCFMWYRDWRVVIFLNITDWLVFVIEVQCVLYEEGTGFLNIIYTDFILQWPRKLAICPSPLKTSFDIRPVHVEFMVVKVALGQAFLQVLRLFLSISLHQCFIQALCWLSSLEPD